MYLKFRFHLTTTDPLKTVGICKILHINVASMGTLETLPLILENVPF